MWGRGGRGEVNVLGGDAGQKSAYLGDSQPPVALLLALEHEVVEDRVEAELFAQGRLDVVDVDGLQAGVHVSRL